MNRKIMKAEDSYDFLKDEVHCLYEENKNLKEDFKRHMDRINELTNRIDKAIEYIEKFIPIDNDTILMRERQRDYLLDILKGSDK